MKRREFMIALGAAAVWPRKVTAQNAIKVYRVGSLNHAAPLGDKSPFGAALIGGLAQYGYELDRNLVLEHRGAEMQLDRLPRLLNELVTSRVDCIVAFGYPSALAAKRGTTLPIVSFATGDPVGTGLVDSLARPGGNTTGVSDVSAEVTPKRLQLLKEMVPNLRRVAMLWNAANLGMTPLSGRKLAYRMTFAVG
jgi:putative ABC transport system substrate-binding protein